MDQETLDIVYNQTNCKDCDVIQKIYLECNKDIVETLAKLSNITECASRNKTQPSEFDEFRKIMDEKEKIFYERTGKGI